MTHIDEAQLAELLRLLPPPPDGWVRAAQELPLFRRTLDEIVERAEADARFRQALLADLEAAVAAEGYEAEPRLLDAIRHRLRSE
jgi:hypothetical protein